MKEKAAEKIVASIIAILVFTFSLKYIAQNFRWADIVPILEQARIIYLIGGGIFTIIIYWLLRAMRLFILLKNLDVRASFSDLYFCSAVSLGLSMMTPFQSGEALKIELLKKYSTINRISGYSSFVVERVLDLFVVVTLSTVGILGIFDIEIEKSIAICVWIVLMVLIICGSLVIMNIKKKGRIGEYINCMRLCISNARTLIIAVTLTICSWIVVAIGWQLSLYSISIDIAFLKSIALTSIVSVVNVFSFIPGSLGVSEVSITEVLMRFGQSSTSAQAGALVLRFYGILILFLSAIHLIVWRTLNLKRNINPKVKKPIDFKNADSFLLYIILIVNC